MTPFHLSFFMMLLPALTSCSPGGTEMPVSNSQGMGMMSGETPEEVNPGMMGRMMGGDRPMADMATIRVLLASHERIERRVENVPGGVRTATVSDDPQVARSIRRHVREMRDRYGRGQPIRMMDPVFRELFRHRGEATMTIEDIPGGARVLHTSDDPQVALLIRQHAHRFVSEAAEHGMRRAMRPTPLPDGYRTVQD